MRRADEEVDAIERRSSRGTGDLIPQIESVFVACVSVGKGIQGFGRQACADPRVEGVRQVVRCLPVVRDLDRPQGALFWAFVDECMRERRVKSDSFLR